MSSRVFKFHASIYLILLACVIPAAAQRVAVLSPDASESSRSFAKRLEGLIAPDFRIIDSEMSETAFASTSAADNFNLSTDESKAVGSAIGSDFFILVKADTARRSSAKRSKYYESHVAIYTVSSRTGRLVFWTLIRFEGATPSEAQKLLTENTAQLATDIGKKMKAAVKSELVEPTAPKMEMPPEPDSPFAISFRAPIPYRRIKPEYSAEAFLYSITATVDVIVDIDDHGSILRTEIIRWAGYGLDESVERAVRSMNWRPAERNGKRLPMRFLLRYNFKKPDKD